MVTKHRHVAGLVLVTCTWCGLLCMYQSFAFSSQVTKTVTREMQGRAYTAYVMDTVGAHPLTPPDRFMYSCAATVDVLCESIQDLLFS